MRRPSAPLALLPAALGAFTLLPIGCRAPAPTQPASAAAAAAIPTGHPGAALGGLAGRWVSEDGRAEETWTAAGAALFGVGFDAAPERGATAFEVRIVRPEEDGRLILAAMPDGRSEVRRPLAEHRPGAARFARSGDDDAASVRYAWTGEGASAVLTAQGGDATWARPRAYRASPSARAAELEAADGRLAADSAGRGADAWFEALDPEGAMGRPDGRIEGPEAVRGAIQLALAGGRRLEWSASASGLAPAGDLGFTSGEYRVRAPTPGGLATEHGGGYVAVWRKRGDGGWRLLHHVVVPTRVAP